MPQEFESAEPLRAGPEESQAECALPRIDVSACTDADFRSVFRASPDILLLLTPDFRMVESSDVRLEATSTTREDTLGRNLFEVFPDNPDNAEAAGETNLRASLMRVLATKRPHEMPLQRYDLLRPDGTFEERYWRPLNVPVLGADGDVRYIIHRVEDATADQRLETSQTELRREQGKTLRQKALADSIINNAPAGIVYYDTDLVIRRVNPTLTGILGIPAERMIDHRVTEVFPGLDVEGHYDPVLKRGETVHRFNFEHRYEVNGEQRLRFWDFVNVPVYGDDGVIEGILGMALDVTERKKSEALIRSQIQDLQQMDRMKDQFLGILSHELRTPINAVMGFGSVLADGLVGELNSEQQKYIGKILDSTDALLDLVNDLLDMSRVQAGKIALDLRPVEPASLIRSTVADLAVEAVHKGLSIVNEVPADLPALWADAQRMRQMVANLVTNAIKYTPEGGVVTVRAKEEGAHLVVEIADTGVGVAPEQQARIFQAFTQVDMTSTRAKGGVGLGLSIVKALVEAHGGEVGVRSEGEGRGSLFFLRLPLNPAERATK